MLDYLYNTIRFILKIQMTINYSSINDEIIKSQPTITNNVVKNIPMNLFSEGLSSNYQTI